MKKDIKEKEGTWITIYFNIDEGKKAEDFKKKYMDRITGIVYINK